MNMEAWLFYHTLYVEFAKVENSILWTASYEVSQMQY